MKSTQTTFHRQRQSECPWALNNVLYTQMQPLFLVFHFLFVYQAPGKVISAYQHVYHSYNAAVMQLHNSNTQISRVSIIQNTCREMQKWDEKNPDKHMMRKNQNPHEFMIEWKGEALNWTCKNICLKQRSFTVKAGWSFHARLAAQPSMFKILHPDSMQGKLMTLIKVPRFPLMAPHWIS